MVCFEKEADGTYYTGSHHYQKDTPFVVGAEIEFDEISGKEERVGNDKYPRIQPVKAQTKGFGGGGSRVKTIEELKNDLPSYVGRYVTDLMSHRITLGKGNTAESIADDFDILAKRIHKTLKELFDL